MPWSTSSSTSVQLAHNQKNRRKQIEKMKQNKLIVTELHRDVQYRVDFFLKKEGLKYSIMIDLPPAFPSEAPMLFVHPPCSHKYLDIQTQLVVNFPPLDNFKNRPDLAYVIKKFTSELEKNPPTLLHTSSDYQAYEKELSMHAYASQYPSLDNVSSSLGGIQVSSSQTSNSTGPELPDVIPELEDLTVEDLKELLEDDVQLIGLFHQTDLAKKLQKDRDEISERIEEAANSNLAQSEKLEKSREELMRSFEKCVKLKEEYERNREKYMEASEWTSLNNLSLTLEVSAAEKDEESEKIAESFLEGEIDVTDFTKQFIKAKVLATTRKIQEDKIRHIMNAS